MDNATVSQFAETLKAELGLQSFSLSLRSNGDLYLGMLAVPKDARKQGVGSEAMRRLTQFADANGLRITLTTGVQDPHWGTTSQSRLISFYKRFGFVHNSGRNKDFSISGNMYREPKRVMESFRDFYNTKVLVENELEKYSQVSAQDFETGKPVTFRSARNVAGVRQFAQQGDFGQDIEPHGLYMNHSEGPLPKASGEARPGFSKWEYAVTHLAHPLVIDSENWKQELSQRYGGKTGAELSDAIIADGYDGIVTKDKYGIGEIVKLARKG